MLPAAVVEEEEVVAAGEVEGLLDAVVGITAVVISRPVGVEFAILAGAGGGVDLDLLEFNEAAGKGGPTGDSRKGVPVVGTKGGGAEVAVFEEELAVVGGVKWGVGGLVEGGGGRWWGLEPRVKCWRLVMLPPGAVAWGSTPIR